MKFSTRSEYGLRALVILAANHGEGPLPLRTVAQREELSEHYLEQLFRDLKKANLLISMRGVHGGYLLAKPPQAMNLREIITALEGEIAPCDCVREDQRSACLRNQPCLVQGLWFRLRDEMNRMLEQITLADLCAGKV